MNKTIITTILGIGYGVIASLLKLPDVYDFLILIGKQFQVTIQTQIVVNILVFGIIGLLIGLILDSK